MLCRERIAVCSEIHTKHMNAICGQNWFFLMLNLVVYKASTGPQGLNSQYDGYLLHPHCRYFQLKSRWLRRLKFSENDYYLRKIATIFTPVLHWIPYKPKHYCVKQKMASSILAVNSITELLKQGSVGYWKRFG